MGDQNVCIVKEITGDVVLTVHIHITSSLSNVRHIHDLKRNMTSLGVLDDIRCMCISKHGVMKVPRSRKLILSVRKVNGMHLLNDCVKHASLIVVPITKFDKNDI